MEPIVIPTVSTTSAHQTLLQTIDEREKELSRIRHAAHKIVQEEKRSSSIYVHSLQSDLQQHQNSLKEKDELIQSLYVQLNKVDNDFGIYQKQVDDEANDIVQRHIEKYKYELTREREMEAKNFEERERKILQSEYEDKLSCCEKDLRNEYQTSLLAELQRQEEMICTNFDKITLEKQKHFATIEKELQEKLMIADRKLAENSFQYESISKVSNENLLHELESQANMFEKQRKAYEQEIAAAFKERESMSSRCKCLESHADTLQGEDATSKAKILELQSIIQYTEESFVHQLEGFEQHLHEQYKERDMLQNKLRSSTNRLREIKSSHQREVKGMRKIHGEAMTIMQAHVKELESKIHTLEDSVGDQEAITERIKRENATKLKRLNEELDEMKIEFEEVQASFYRREDEIKRSTLEKYKRNHREMVKKIERKATDANGHLESEILAMTRQRDTVVRDKEKLENNIYLIQQELHNIQQRSNDRKEHGSEETRMLQLELEEVIQEKKKLKETISVMRNEMEIMSSNISPSEKSLSRRMPNTITTCFDETKSIQLLNSVLMSLRTCRTSTTGMNQVEKITELIDQILVALGSKSVSEMHLHNRNEAKKLKDICRDLTFELETISSERDNLIDLSNRLQADIARMKEDNEAVSVQRHGRKGSLDLKQSTSFDIDVQDFAESLWSKAIQGSNNDCSHKIPMRSSERTTNSQKVTLKNIRRSNSKRQQGKESNRPKEKNKVRNWNSKDDKDKG